MAKADRDKIKQILERNVVEVIEKNDLENLLNSGKKLRIKLGIDPTGPRLHLGRAISLRKLRNFQEAGHKIVLIIGDFTALVGDASDKQSARSQLTKEQIKRNMKDYKKQIGKILDIKKTEFHYNSKWLAKLKFEDVLRIASLFTVHQLIDRRNFKERFEAGKIIGFQEFMYPLMQGYDSVAIKADVEIGGTDQLFNLMAGRKLQEFYGQKPQNIMTLEMLDGLDGQKMSTSQGNVINITDTPDDMFGKIMSMRDEMIMGYFKTTTDISDERLGSIKAGLDSGSLNPLEAKKDLAFEIVRMYHDSAKAERAKEKFESVFQKKELSADSFDEIKVQQGEELSDISVKRGLVASLSSFRRLIKSGSIDFEGEAIKDVHFRIKKSGVVRIGKKIFVKLIVG
ncbi:MAG: tyrosine--tRNA ligase [Candidatus Pacebacteria bacterium]|nr:tyrosine--tRNA ligase [Candidatus Paceibacterota bacterium]